MPLKGQSPAAMDWATADTETDASLFAAAIADDEKLKGLGEPLDESFLDEAMPSS